MKTMQARTYQASRGPGRLILGPRPNECSCSWAAKLIEGRMQMYLKQINNLCLLHRGEQVA
jgi:hypothetical protein